MRRVIIGLIGWIFLFSCKDPTPKGVLPITKMAALMVDIHMIDGYLSTLPVDSAAKYIHSYYQGAYKNHKIDSNQFDLNLKYYAAHPQEFDKVYEKVNASLNDYYAQTEIVFNDDFNERSRLDSITNVRIRDSIRRRELDSIRLDNTHDFLFWRADSVGFVRRMEIKPSTGYDILLETLGLKVIRRAPESTPTSIATDPRPHLPPPQLPEVKP
jgi:hypothetical protein